MNTPTKTNFPKVTLKIPKPKPWYDILYGYMKKCNSVASPTPSPSLSNELDCMSSHSSISLEMSKLESKSPDIQSICIEEDIHNLAKVSIEDTTLFTPNIQYGKVLEVCNPREIIVASRIYNGYTKVLQPKLYRFHIRLFQIPYFDDKEVQMTQSLSNMILNKVVLLTDVFMNPMDGMIYANVNIDGISVNEYIIQRSIITL